MSELLKKIENAREGKVVTIPFIHKKLARYIFLGKNLYHLIGGASGSGKSSWVDLNYVINPIMWIKKYGEQEGIKLKIVLRSMERSKVHRKAKWVCMKLYLDHKILIDPTVLLGWGSQKNRITDELYEKIKEANEFVESLEEYVDIIDGIDNPTGVYKNLRHKALSKGILYQYKDGKPLAMRNDVNGIERSRNMHEGECDAVEPFQPVYVPDNFNEITLFIVDHLQAMKTESGNTDKQNFDKMSEYARVMRDLYGFSPIMVSQLNRNVSDTFRRVKTELLPEDKDFSGSSNMYNDCDMAGILFNPYKYQMSDLKGYMVKQCVQADYGIDRFRSFHLLKNTYGPDNQIFGYKFVGENGLFYELPKPTEMSTAEYKNVANPPFTQRLTNYENI